MTIPDPAGSVPAAGGIALPAVTTIPGPAAAPPSAAAGPAPTARPITLGAELGKAALGGVALALVTFQSSLTGALAAASVSDTRALTIAAVSAGVGAGLAFVGFFGNSLRLWLNA